MPPSLGRAVLPTWVALFALAGCGGVGVQMSAAALELRAAATLPLLEGSVPIVLADVDGTPIRLVVDTGAEATQVTATATARLGFEPLPYSGTSTSTGSGGKSVAVTHFVATERLAIGGLVAHLGRLPVLDAPGLAAHGIDGILGMDIMSRVVTVFDLERQQLHFLPGSGVEAVQAWLEASSIGKGNWLRVDHEDATHVWLPLTVPGREAPVGMKLDTGADSTSLPATAIAGLDLQPVGMGSAFAVGGDVTEPQYRIEGLGLLGLAIGGVFRSRENPVGLLGTDVVRSLVLVVDGPARQVWVHKRS